MENVKLSKVTHQGKWVVSDDIVIKCYVTDDKKRLLSLRGTVRAMDVIGNGSRALLRILQSKWIDPYLSDQLRNWAYMASVDKIDRVKAKSGPAIIPFEASLFVDVCKAYILANNDGVLPKNRAKIAGRLLGIMTAFAKVGIDSLVDEITGYQEERQQSDLQNLLSKYICEEFLEWTKIFPDEFYEQLFRLKNWAPFEKGGQQMPQVVGYYTNDIVYERLPDRVLKTLKEKTPKSEAGNNLVKLHQSLSKDIGINHLQGHLIAVIALMKSSDSWNQFLYMLDRSYQRRGQAVMRFF